MLTRIKFITRHNNEGDDGHGLDLPCGCPSIHICMSHLVFQAIRQELSGHLAGGSTVESPVDNKPIETYFTV